MGLIPFLLLQGFSTHQQTSLFGFQRFIKLNLKLFKQFNKIRFFFFLIKGINLNFCLKGLFRSS